MNIATGIEVYEVTPADLLGAFVAFLVIVLVAVGLGWWGGLGAAAVEPEDEGEADDGGEAESGAEADAPADVDADADPVETVEIRTRGRSRPHRTGTFHAPGLVVPPDETVVIDPAAVSRGR